MPDKKFSLINPQTWFNREGSKEIPNPPTPVIPLEALKDIEEKITLDVFKQVLPPAMPTGASASSATGYDVPLLRLGSQVNYVDAKFNRTAIEVIKKLSYVHPDVSQAVDTLVKLSNTGYTIRFDSSVKPDMMDKMRRHINQKMVELCAEYGGVSGFINRLLRQIYVGGAISGEWVPQTNLRSLRKIILVSPEKIYWTFDRKKKEWFPYQQVEKTLASTSNLDQMVPLNKKTYRYYALMGDDDLPYGIPPFLSALEPIEVQRDMLKNIRAIVKQMGIVGFLQALIEKEEKLPSESDEKYKARMESLLAEAQKRLTIGLADGITVGFKDDVEFEFHTPTKATTGASDLFIENELLLMSGLKIDSSMLGRGYSTSEGQITVVFNKLLSELKNVQNCLRSFLEYGFKMELVMAGYTFDTLEVQFNASTINDDLKYQQAREIRIRNAISMYNQGIWDNDQVADELGEEKANKKEPRVMTDPASTAQKKAGREAGKDASDRANRRKNRPGEKSQKDKGTKTK